MSRRKKEWGSCRLCGAVGWLSFEHVPNRKAFNDRPIVKAGMDLYLADREQMFRRGRIQQGGAGAFTLCGRCNSQTGHWYGRDYVDWAWRALELLGRFPPTGVHEVQIRSRPLRFLKQALTMMFSVNRTGFADEHEDLRRFVLDPKRTGLSPRYEVYLTLVRSGLSRTAGRTGLVSLESGKARTLCEVVHVPFALLLTIDSDPLPRCGQISWFSQFGYDEWKEVAVPLFAGEAHTPFPGDYRTQDQVDRDAAAGDAFARLPKDEQREQAPAFELETVMRAIEDAQRRLNR